MGIYTNRENVPLSLAVFLATDTYDSSGRTEKTISVTSLIKPLKPSILCKRVPPNRRITDISDLIASRIGSAIHESIESAWTKNYKDALLSLGYPKHVVERVRVNPDPDTVTEDDIPVYTEQRFNKEINGYTITGEFDFVAEGGLEDFKSTSTFTWQAGTKDDDYQLQGSIYRWLKPEIITKDFLKIRFIFTDWSKLRARQDPNYPQKKIEERTYPLLSLKETERYITQKLQLIEMYQEAPEADIPECSDADLWRSAPQWKYYKNPKSKARSTKNFDTYKDAYQRWIDDGRVGEVVEVPGTVQACKYCLSAPICQQKERLITSGELDMPELVQTLTL